MFVISYFDSWLDVWSLDFNNQEKVLGLGDVLARI
jgi:hypothetical protein